jgi:hypothetical protein
MRKILFSFIISAKLNTEQDYEHWGFFLLGLSFTLASTNCTEMPSLRVQTTSLIRWLAELRISVKESIVCMF